ncbi:hypothetical protein LJR238_004530 [Pararhizobium sp. LjRoot238]
MAITAFAPSMQEFRCGRNFAAWLGRCDCALLRWIRPQPCKRRPRCQCRLHRSRARSQPELGRCFGISSWAEAVLPQVPR